MVRKDNSEIPYIIAVGWDRKIHVWADTKDELTSTSVKLLPQTDQSGHQENIMSAAFCEENNLIDTGAHDGTLIGWSFETGYIKQYLHDLDPTCTSKDYIL